LAGLFQIGLLSGNRTDKGMRMPRGFSGWAVWFAAQTVFTFIWHIALKLGEHAMLGWGDDQIAVRLGITSPSLSTAFTWAVPFILAALTLTAYHLVQVQWFGGPKVAIHTIGNPRGAVRENIISQIPRHLYAQASAAQAALGKRVIAGWVLIIGAVIALVVGAALLVTWPPSSVQSGNRSPLQETIDSYLAKSGKTANYLPGATGPNVIQTGDAHDGQGPFITLWGDGLGSWPSTDDGFSVNQLRIFPHTKPKFTTQYDREKFRGAVDALSEFINQKTGDIVTSSQNVAGIRPMVSRGRAGEILARLQQIQAEYNDIHSKLIDRQSFFDAYPSYRAELIGIMPDNSQPPWNNYYRALVNLIRAIELAQKAEGHPDDMTLWQLAVDNVGPLQDTFVRDTSDLRDWMTSANNKIKLMIRVI
jgi:hypothetical protein